MNKMESLCKIRDIYRAIVAFEVEFEQHYHLTLNEGMLLFSLNKAETLSAGEIASTLGLLHSNASKVIRSVEDKGLIERVLGQKDRRLMYFSLTDKGDQILADIKCGEMALPEILQEVVKKNSAE